MRARSTIIQYLCLLLLLIPIGARADERVRQAQEELRRRNLYFGNIDGKPSPDLTNALRHYQARKGFAVTGAIDEVTAGSLRIQVSEVEATQSTLPDIPVLKSDRAPVIDESQRVALEQKSEAEPDFLPSPPPPAEPPDVNQEVNPARIRNFIEQYLRDGESNDLDAQTRYFDFPVQYFADGKQGADWVRKDVANYVKDWPERRYTLQEPINFFNAEKDGEITVEFPISYHVQNPARRDTGKRYDLKGRTKNIWTIRPEGGELKIVAINEQRLRE
ncbi:MAG: peptidoglycan-binding domain-containing protein [Chthoniobacterales bacterium]